MASTIIIKNGAGSSTPSSLKQGELAINVDNGKLFYGTSGSSNAVSSSFSFQHITASGNISASGNIIAVSASIQHLDGPEGGEISFTGGNPTLKGEDGAQISLTDDATISGGNNKLVVLGNISASGELHGNNIALTNNGDNIFSVSNAGALSASGELHGNSIALTNNGDNVFSVTNAGAVSASSTIAGTALTLATNGVTKASIDASGNITTEGLTTTKNTDGGNTVIQIINSNGDVGTDKGAGIEFLHGSAQALSGNQKAGKILATKASSYNYNTLNIDSNLEFYTANNNTDTLQLKIDNTGLAAFTSEVSSSSTGSFVSLNITDAGIAKFNVDTNGHVSASGDISSSTALLGRNLTLATNGVNVATIDTSGNVSSSAALFGTALNVRQAGTHKVSINPEGNGNIAAEGFISSSGVLSGTSLTLATNGSTRASINASGEITSGNISSSGVLNANTVQLANNGINTLNISNAGAISASSTIQGTAFTAQTNGITTATIDASGNISSSGGTITTSTLVGHGTTTELAVNGDISSSAVLKGNTAQFAHNGINTLNVSNAGAISASSTIQGTAFTAQTNGATKATIGASGDIAAEGNISSSAALLGTRLTLTSAGVHKAAISPDGEISAEGFISSSGELHGNSIALTNNGDNVFSVTNAGAISASSTIQGTALTLQDAGINTLTVDTIGNVSSSATGSFRALTIADDGVTQAAIDAEGGITGSAFQGTKHILRCMPFYVNDDPFIQNGVYFGGTLNHTPSNWNDFQDAGGAISSQTNFDIVEDDMNWGIILPFDIKALEIQISLRAGGACTGEDFTAALYTANRSDNSNTAITLTKVAHSQTTFAQGIYKTNDFTHTADLDKGTMIFVGVGTESSSPAAKNARGIMNITAIQR